MGAIEWQKSFLLPPGLPAGSELWEAGVDGGILKAGFLNTPKVSGAKILEVKFEHHNHDECRWPTFEEISSAMQLCFPVGSLMGLTVIVGFHRDFKKEDAIENEPFSRTLQFLCVGRVDPAILS